MGGPPVPVALVRVATRRALSDLTPGELVIVACSGGADSMALAAAVAFEAPRAQLRAGLVTIDHQLQPKSAAVADQVVTWAGEQGLAPVAAIPVVVGSDGGPEAAARDARYAALSDAAQGWGATAILLAHTREDQAETVLLAMARGAGAHALAGMPARRGVFRRPLLSLPRDVVRAAAFAENLPVWEDPHNDDPAYARSRLRMLLPALEEAVGPGTVAGLARTADLIRADTELLDELAARRADELIAADLSIDAEALAAEPTALRTRILHRWAIQLGAAPGALSSVHIGDLDALVMAWRGQGTVSLPSGLIVVRRNARLLMV